MDHGAVVCARGAELARPSPPGRDERKYRGTTTEAIGRGWPPAKTRLDWPIALVSPTLLLYFNVEHVRDRFFELLHAHGEGVKLAVFFLGTTLRERGIALRLAEARGDVRETLRRAGFEERCAPVVANQTVATVIEQWRAGAGPS